MSSFVQSTNLYVDVDTRMLQEDRGSPSSMSELDSAIGTSTGSPSSARKANSGCSSMSDRDEENFECFGEDVDLDSDFRKEDTFGMSLCSPPNSLPPANFTKRNSWARRSLRAAPSSNTDRLVPPRRWGSFRQWHRDPTSNTSMEDSEQESNDDCTNGNHEEPLDVINPKHDDDPEYLLNKVQMLQQQVGVLAENQVNTDDRFSRAKQDNSALQARVMMLEEQLRETELRAEERLSDEQKRNREMIGRVEREKTLTVENYAMKYATIDKEKTHLSEDLSRLKDNLQKSLKEKSELEGRLSEADLNSESLRVDNSRLVENNRRDKEELKVERERGSQVIEELRCEIERLRAVEEAYRKRAPSTDSSITADMDAQIKQLSDQNKQLQEQLEELQAQLLTSRLEEGRTLLSTTSNSLAAEFDQMNSQEDAQFSSEQEKLRKSVKDYQEENQQLRNYIDEILLNIVDNYPQLLEVKHK